MALRGNLDDFNIVNILQMIKLEGKTGRLTLAEAEEVVKITFDKGFIIYAEGASNKDESRLENVLLTNNLVEHNSWREIQKEHEDKLKPYWELLSKKIHSKLLLELINRQVIDTVYFALRWTKGSYEFTPIKSLKYNKKMMAQMDVDGLLIEGCTIADEWPRIAATLPPFSTFVIKNIIGEDEADESLNVKANESGSGDFGASLEYDILSARGITLNGREMAVLNVVGTGKTLKEIMDAARQRHFESLEAMLSLFRMGILKPATKKAVGAGNLDKKKYFAQLAITAALLAVVVAGFAWRAKSWPENFRAQKEGITRVKHIQALDGLKNIENGLKIYQSLEGRAPESLDDLVESGILKQSELIDPWNNRYQLVFKKKKFALFSTGHDSFLSTDNVYLPPPLA
ncbi:hypothetical protein MNBD_NITROSPINAE02-1051 [hydrothermal vent metagenome]|uniref:PatA-like N-terminal domain-containing protein n=1 Tax=hydrothermal vent metagenome TaxID=652676 RepID=A0A3B1CHN4_9ZZZZ